MIYAIYTIWNSYIYLSVSTILECNGANKNRIS